MLNSILNIDRMFLLSATPLALLWSYNCLGFAGYLKSQKGLKTGYTRKVFHFLIFSSAVVFHLLGGFVAVCLFGITVSIVVGHALLRGPGNPRYEALAREQDGAYRTYYIVIPFFATMIGGIASNVFFGPIAAIGYLVGGLGDAAGEPVGTRWGRHHYFVGRAMIARTFEGSLGVLAASSIALLIGVAIRPELHFNFRSAIALPVIAIICTLIEGLSPRGWDNASMQIVPTALAAILLKQ